MGPFPHDAPPATISAAQSRWAPTASSSSSLPIRGREELHALFERMGYAPVARHKTRNITVYRQGDINYLVNEEPGTHARPLRRRARTLRAVDGVARRRRASRPIERALSLGAEPADIPAARQDARRARHQGHRRHRCSISSTATAPRARPMTPSSTGSARAIRKPRGRRASLSRSPHPQRPSRQHGRLDRLLRRSCSTSARSASSTSRAKLTGLFSRALTSPDGKIRIPINEDRRRHRPDRGISAASIKRRGHPAHRLRHRATSTSDRRERCAPTACRSCRRRPTPTTRRVDARLPGHGEPIARLKRDGILIDGEGVVDGGRHQGPAADLLHQRRSGRSSSSSSSARATTASAKAISRRCSNRSRKTRSAAAC